MLTAADINNIQVLLQRVNLKGDEAITVATIQLKLKSMYEELKEDEPETEEEEDET